MSHNLISHDLDLCSHSLVPLIHSLFKLIHLDGLYWYIFHCVTIISNYILHSARTFPYKHKQAFRASLVSYLTWAFCLFGPEHENRKSEGLQACRERVLSIHLFCPLIHCEEGLFVFTQYALPWHVQCPWLWGWLSMRRRTRHPVRAGVIIACVDVGEVVLV